MTSSIRRLSALLPGSKAGPESPPTRYSGGPFFCILTDVTSPLEPQAFAASLRELVRGLLAIGLLALVANAVAEHLACFDEVIASDAHSNRRGESKLAAVTRAAGARP